MDLEFCLEVISLYVDIERRNCNYLFLFFLFIYFILFYF